VLAVAVVLLERFDQGRIAHVTGRGPAPQLLVPAVDNARVRFPEPTPHPPLPQRLPRSGFA
jgi:hypothetical protein